MRIIGDELASLRDIACLARYLIQSIGLFKLDRTSIDDVNKWRDKLIPLLWPDKKERE